MIFSAKDKELFKEIFNKEFPLTVRDLFQIIILICIVVIFSELLANKIGKLLINDGGTILGSKNRVPFAFFVILLISTIAFYICLARNDFIPSKKMLFFTFLIGIVAYQTTFLNQHFFFACFVYVVIFFLCQLQLLISHLDWQYQIKKATQIEEDNEKRTKTTQGFLSDEPIPVEKEKQLKPDNKGYSLYAQKIAKKIKESHFEKSFAIGINGQWGSGKTSMSNLIRRHTQDEEDVISIDFKPWSSSTPDAIIKDFFETLQDELSPYHAALSRLLIRYSRKLTTIDSNVITQTIEYAANYILDLDATNKVYEKINNALKDINKKIIIYIDDLDRLEQSEIMEVIRLIRNTANFYNTFFIVTYDKAYVNNALEKADIHNHEKFLEKIFQLEVNLPYYDKGKLREELAIKLKEGLEISESIEKEIKDLDILDDWLENSRDVTRIVNSLLLNYKRVDGFVVFCEFLLIETLRIFNLKLYYDIRCKSSDYFKGNKLKVQHSPKDRNKTIMDYLFRNWNSTKNTSDSMIIKDDIINERRFLFYFQSSDFKGLTLKRYNKLNELGDSEREREIETIINDELSLDLENRILEDIINSKKTFYSHLKTILYYLEKEINNNYFVSHVFEKIKDENFRIALFDNFETEFADFISKLYPNSTTKVFFILSLCDRYKEENEQLDKIPIYATLKKSFETLCENASTYDSTFVSLIDETYNLLYQNVNLKNEILSPVRILIERKALKSFLTININPVGRNLTEAMLKEFINTNKTPLKFGIASDRIKILYEDNFEELLHNNLSKPYVKEFKEFYDKLKENDFNEVLYDFSEISIKDRVKEILAPNY